MGRRPLGVLGSPLLAVWPVAQKGPGAVRIGGTRAPGSPIFAPAQWRRVLLCWLTPTCIRRARLDDASLFLVPVVLNADFLVPETGPCVRFPRGMQAVRSLPLPTEGASVSHQGITVTLLPKLAFFVL